MRRKLAAVAVAGLASVATATPAFANHNDNRGNAACPGKFRRVTVNSVNDPRARRVDRNDNGFVCFRNTQGRGNTGQGFSLKDDRIR